MPSQKPYFIIEKVSQHLMWLKTSQYLPYFIGMKHEGYYISEFLYAWWNRNSFFFFLFGACVSWDMVTIPCQFSQSVGGRAWLQHNCRITVSKKCYIHVFNFFVSIQEDGFIKELSITMQLLRNCLYQNEECKVSRAPQSVDSSLR